MRITIFGSTGFVGRGLTIEAVRRGHTVTSVVREPDRAADLPLGVAVAVADATDPRAVAAVAGAAEVVISATRPPEGREDTLVDMTSCLLEGLRAGTSRLIAVGGAATLRVEGSGELVLHDSNYLHPAAGAIARACVDQHARYLKEAEVDWTYVSPPASLTDGPRTGVYRTGLDTLLVDDEGKSRISTADFAFAVLDEVEQPRHTRRRFTVAY